MTSVGGGDSKRERGRSAPAVGLGSERQYLLAIESSCDETAAAVVDNQLNVLSNVVASHADLHVRFGGVVPEIASRAHVERILPVIDEATSRSGLALSDLAAIAVVTHPGLVGSLLVGLTAAKSLAAVLDVPLVAVNHVEGHLYACRMVAGPSVFPAIGLVVSGGHSNLYDCRDGGEFKLLGSTIDDAAGEAFDKVAKILGLPYPGGPSIAKAAESGDPNAFHFPRPMIADKGLDFSFSGLKTAVLYEACGQPGGPAPSPLSPQRVADISAAFQEAVVDVLVSKCRRALDNLGYKSLCVGGGVAANKRLRERLRQLGDELGVTLVLAPLEYCTDNAAMAAIAWEQLARGDIASLDVDVTPGTIRRQR
jgi:N6-L-threonylcarbamoyladenine synthase